MVGRDQHGEVILVREQSRPVGVEHPQPHDGPVGAFQLLDPTPVCEVEEAVVRANAAAHSGQPGDRRITSVRSDEKRRTDLHIALIAIFDRDLRRSLLIGADLLHRPSREVLDPRGADREIAQERVERATRDAPAQG